MIPAEPLRGLAIDGFSRLLGMEASSEQRTGNRSINEFHRQRVFFGHTEDWLGDGACGGCGMVNLLALRMKIFNQILSDLLVSVNLEDQLGDPELPRAQEIDHAVTAGQWTPHRFPVLTPGLAEKFRQNARQCLREMALLFPAASHLAVGLRYEEWGVRPVESTDVIPGKSGAGRDRVDGVAHEICRIPMILACQAGRFPCSRRGD